MHKLQSNVFFVFLIIMLIAIGLVVNIDTPTGNVVKENGTKKLGDYIAGFLDVEDFVFETSGIGCISAKQIFDDFLDIAPEQLESFVINERSGFATLVFTETYDVGILTILKGRDFLEHDNSVRLDFQVEKMVFTKYSDKVKSIKLNLSVNGFIEEDVLVINSGSLTSEGVGCDFS